MDRIAMLTEILARNGDDILARYGLAMEFSKQGDVERALGEFRQLIAKKPDYAAAYFMAAQALAKANRTEEARRMLNDGIAAANRSGDAHAESEMQAMLAELAG